MFPRTTIDWSLNFFPFHFFLTLMQTYFYNKSIYSDLTINTSNVQTQSQVLIFRKTERQKRAVNKSGTYVFNISHQSGQGTLKMSLGSCPLVKVSGEMFTTLDNQGQQVERDVDTLLHTQIHTHIH